MIGLLIAQVRDFDTGGAMPEVIGDPNTKESVATLVGVEAIVNNAISILLALGGITLFIMLIVGGFSYLTAGGNEKQMQKAKLALTYAIGGFVLLVLGYLIIVFIAKFTGNASIKFFDIIV